MQEETLPSEFIAEANEPNLADSEALPPGQSMAQKPPTYPSLTDQKPPPESKSLSSPEIGDSQNFSDTELSSPTAPVSRRSFLKSTAIAAGTALVGSSELPITERDARPENKYELIFESGVHAFLGSQYEEVEERFRQGDLTAHLWPGAVAKRMRQYQPALIALDSLRYNGLIAAEWWMWFPGSPQQMTGRDKALLLAGDPLFASNISPIEEEKGFGPEIRQEEVKELHRLIMLSLAEGMGTLATGTALKYISSTKEPSTLTDQPSFQTGENISRRTFFKRSAGLAGNALLLATLGRAAPIIQSYTTESQFTGILNTITEMTRPLIARSDWWLDGRTAFTIAKTKDGMALLNLPEGAKASLVFGYPHAYESGPLLENKDYRAELMQKFALRLVDIVVAVNNKIPIWKLSDEQQPHTREIIQNDVLNFLSWASVYEVSEPQLKPDETPQQTVLKSINEKLSFESGEVKEALQPLRSGWTRYTQPPI